MSTPAKAFLGAAIHDGTTLHESQALLTFTDGSAEIAALDTLPVDCPTHWFDGGTILPGFVDLQVNGGGGVMFNDNQSVETLAIIAQAHASTGTAAILPTLITDTAERTQAAIAAVEQAINERVPGIVGIHLEGPHLSVARKGAHDPALIRPMEDADLALLLSAADRLPNIMLTVAPETCSNAQIKVLSQAGITVSLGHTDASYDTCMAAFEAGARCVTHLFNAMSQLGSREPGLVGAALAHGDIYAGIIADGIHVHPAVMRAALDAKRGADKVFLVTDAMATVGSDISEFTLNGRKILRDNGRLTLTDGTLAGADLDMPRATSVIAEQVGQPLEKTLKRATSTPTALLRHSFDLGQFKSKAAGLIHLGDEFSQPRWISEIQA